MSTSLEASLSVLAERLLHMANTDIELASALRTLAESVLNHLGREESSTRTTGAEVSPLAVEPDNPRVDYAADMDLEGEAAPEPLPRLQMQVGFQQERSPAHRTVYACGEGGKSAIDLPAPGQAPAATINRLMEIGQQMAMKARVCRWGLENLGAAISTAPEELLARTGEREWHPWMITRFRPVHPEDANWLRLEQVFLGAAETCSNLAVMMEDENLRERFAEQGLSLARQVAEALAHAVAGVGQGYDCSQLALTAWLEAARREHAWAARQEPSTRDGDADLMGGIAALREEMEAARHFSKEQRQLFNKARFHSRKIAGSKSDPPAVVADWRSLASALDGLVRRCGVRPSSREIRPLLLPIHEQLPILDDVPLGFDLCLRALDDYLALGPAQSRAADPVPDAACVAQARHLLQGTRVVLIGGDMRPDARRRLEEALGIKELIWVRSKVHASVEGFRPAIVRPDVSLALLAIRWSSHSYVEVRDFCEASGKPLVWLAGGYNPNQVAHQIMQQASERLAALQEPQQGLAHAV